MEHSDNRTNFRNFFLQPCNRNGKQSSLTYFEEYITIKVSRIKDCTIRVTPESKWMRRPYYPQNIGGIILKSISLLIKPASSLCNLRCKYCFYEDEAQNRTHHSMGMMSESLADQLIQRVFQAADAGASVSFSFQGGEPTVAGLDFFRHFVDTVAAHCPPGVHVHYSLQTNGTLLTDEWAAFLKSNHFLVGLSIDGTRAIHDTHRLDATGAGTWRTVLAAKSLLEKHRVDFNALCVVTGPCAQQPEQIYKNLKNLGFRHMQFIPCLDPIGHARGMESWSLSPVAYGEFLCKLFDLWFRDWNTGNYHSIRLFDDYIHILIGSHASTCATCGKCGIYFVVEGDGSVYPCDFYVLDQWKIGTLQDMTLTEIASNTVAQRFLAWGTEKPSECQNCTYQPICNGGCKNDWYSDDTGSHNYFCPAFQALFRHAMPRMKMIAAAEIRARQRR